MRNHVLAARARPFTRALYIDRRGGGNQLLALTPRRQPINVILRFVTFITPRLIGISRWGGGGSSFSFPLFLPRPRHPPLRIQRYPAVIVIAEEVHREETELMTRNR